MRTVSKARSRENVQRRKTMAYVRERDGHECVGAKINPATGRPFLLGHCFGPLNGHEIITRAQGGSITHEDNIVLLCNGHNDWCDDNFTEACARGFRQVRRHPYSSTVAERLPHLEPVR